MNRVQLVVLSDNFQTIVSSLNQILSDLECTYMIHLQSWPNKQDVRAADIN